MPPVMSAEPAAAANGVAMPQVSMTATPALAQAQGHHHGHEPMRKGAVVETIILALVCIVAATFIGLFVWKYLEWEEASTNLEGQINEAVGIEVYKETTRLEANFAEREKQPNLEFAGPDDYGRLSFLYPRTWSVYIAKDASRGGDYEAYLNPVEVPPVSAASINALRVVIYTRAYDEVLKQFEGQVKNGKLRVGTFELGADVWTRYDGEFANGIVGSAIFIRIRDKTAMIRTDAEIFLDDFNTLIQTLRYNS
jgi:hypothetical protein